MKTIQERIQDWISTDKSMMRNYAKVIGTLDDYDDKNITLLFDIDNEEGREVWSIYDIFFGPSNYWEVMFGEEKSPYIIGYNHGDEYGGIDIEDKLNNAQQHQIQCLLHIQNGGTIEQYLNNVLDDNTTDDDKK